MEQQADEVNAVPLEHGTLGLRSRLQGPTSDESLAQSACSNRSRFGAIRFWLNRERRLRDGALFALGIDSELRGCDVVKAKIGGLESGGCVRSRVIVIQQETGRPVQFELLEQARGSMLA
jgi:hypothetical protein